MIGPTFHYDVIDFAFVAKRRDYYDVIGFAFVAKRRDQHDVNMFHVVYMRVKQSIWFSRKFFSKRRKPAYFNRTSTKKC